MWWIIVIVIIAIPVVLFLRWGLRLKSEHEEVERAGGIHEWSKNIDARIAKNNERVQRNNERVQRYDESIRKSNELIQRNDEAIRKGNAFSDTLVILERQLEQGLFSDAELAEITNDKQRPIDLALHSAELTEQSIASQEKETALTKEITKFTEETTKLIEKQTTLINKGLTKENNEKIRALDVEIKALNAREHTLEAKQSVFTKEREAIESRIIACDEELFASFAKVEQWVELGKTRLAK